MFNYRTKNLSCHKIKRSKTFKNVSKEDEHTYLDYTYQEQISSKQKSLNHKKFGNQSFLLFPYFIENKSEYNNHNDKYLYIKNRINEIIKMDIQINKIIKTQNVPDYILPSYKRYELYAINEDYKRYFPNSLRYNNNNSEKEIVLSPEFSSEEEENPKIDVNNNSNKKVNNNINNKDINIINEWFNIICSSDKKKLKNNDTNILIKILLSNRKNLSYFCDLIFQDYIPLFEFINSNFKKILIYECLNELYKVIMKILPILKKTKIDKMICKQLTLSLFIYGYFNQKIKKHKFLISKISEFCHTSIVLKDKICPLWNEIEFWVFWISNDLDTYKNNKFFINRDSDENVKESEDNYEYEFFLDVCKIMILLGKNRIFIKNCIFDFIAPKYLTPLEIDELEKETFIDV